LIHFVFSRKNPQNYDFESMGKIEMLERDMSGLDEKDYTQEFLDAAQSWVQKWGLTFSILMVFVWPVLSVPAGIFGKDYFSFWVFISIAWSFLAAFVIIVLPIHESWDSICRVFSFLLGRGSGKPDVAANVSATDETL